MKVTEVAERMNKSPQYVRVGLQRGTLPFGTAIQTSSKWSYHINEEQFEKYMQGDFKPNDEVVLVMDKLTGITNELIEIKHLMQNIVNRKDARK